MPFVPPEPDAIELLLERARIKAVIDRALARRVPQSAPPPPPPPPRNARPFPTTPPSWNGQVPAATVSERLVQVRLWAGSDHWLCQQHGQGQGAGCVHVSFARERASERSERTGQLRQETSWTDFTCRSNITLTSLRFTVKPRKRRKELPTTDE